MAVELSPESARSLMQAIAVALERGELDIGVQTAPVYRVDKQDADK